MKKLLIHCNELRLALDDLVPHVVEFPLLPLDHDHAHHAQVCDHVHDCHAVFGMNQNQDKLLEALLAHLPFKLSVQLLKSAFPLILICKTHHVGEIVSVLGAVHATQDE